MKRTFSLILLLLWVGCAESSSYRPMEGAQPENMTDEEAALQADIDALNESIDSMRTEIDQGFDDLDSMNHRIEQEQQEGDSLRERIEANQREIDAMMGQ